MDCPRCGGRLDRYELADRAEASCGDCGYVGVPVDHESERPADEPWTDVVDRYEETFEGAADVDTGPAPASVPDDDGGDPEPTTVRTSTAVDPPTGETSDDGAIGTSSFDLDAPDGRPGADLRDAGTGADAATENTTDDGPDTDTLADDLSAGSDGAADTDAGGEAETDTSPDPATDDGDASADDTPDANDAGTDSGDDGSQRGIDEYGTD